MPYKSQNNLSESGLEIYITLLRIVLTRFFNNFNVTKLIIDNRMAIFII
jgi:hypothetical protein